MSSQQTNITITINHLNSLLNGVIIAQKRGIYSFEESGILAEPVKVVSQFIKVHTDNEEQKKKEQVKLEHAKLEQKNKQNTNVQIPSTIQEEDLTLKNLTLKNLI